MHSFHRQTEANFELCKKDGYQQGDSKAKEKKLEKLSKK